MIKRKRLAPLPDLMEQQLKKGVTAMMVLAVISIRQGSVNEVVERINAVNIGAFQVAYLYDVLYRLQLRDCVNKEMSVTEKGYQCGMFCVTEVGLTELEKLKVKYFSFYEGVKAALDSLERELTEQNVKE